MNEQTHQRILKNIRYDLFKQYIKRAINVCPIEPITSNLCDELAYAEDHQEDFRLTDKEWVDHKISLVESHKIKKTCWLKGTSATWEPGAKLFDCAEHQRLYGCLDCPKKGFISVCQRAKEFIITPTSMADIEQQTEYTQNWEN